MFKFSTVQTYQFWDYFCKKWDFKEYVTPLYLETKVDEYFDNLNDEFAYALWLSFSKNVNFDEVAEHINQNI